MEIPSRCSIRRHIAQCLNIIVVFLPVFLLFLAVLITPIGENVALNNAKPGSYYTGDSDQSLHYLISQDERQILDGLWLNAASETTLKRWFNTKRQNKTSTVRCGWRWEHNKAEIGAYCYEMQTKTMINYATPPVISYLKSQKGSESSQTRVILLQQLLDDGSSSFSVKIHGKKYLALPASLLGRAKTKSDYVSDIACQVGNNTILQKVGAWSLFDLQVKKTDVTSTSASSLIRYEIVSGGQQNSFGSILQSISSYTSIAAYCDINKNGKLLVGWGGQYFDYGEKKLGFLFNYWPLLLMYLVTRAMAGHAYGENMIIGYDAFMRTGTSTYTAIQVCLFNERLYHVLYNLLSGEVEFKRTAIYFKLEIIMIASAFIIFQVFVVSVSTKTAVGRLYTKYESLIRGIAVLCNLVSLVIVFNIPNVFGVPIGMTRICPAPYHTCLYEYNSTKQYIAINILCLLLQQLIIMFYRGKLRQNFLMSGGELVGPLVKSRIRPCSSEILKWENLEPKTNFERVCMNCGTPKDQFDTSIYNDVRGKPYSRNRYIRFLGFIHIKDVGIIRTKDLWIVFASQILPKKIRQDIPISLFVWKTPKPNEVSVVVRLFWEAVNPPGVIALEEDIA